MSEEIQEIEAVAETPEAVETPDVPQAPQWSQEDVEEAKLFGWKAPEEWQGEKPEGYIDDPSDFLARVQRSRIFKTMQEKLERTETAAQEQSRKLEAMNRMALERQREMHERALAEVRARRDQAAEDGDIDAYKRHVAQEQEIAKAAPQPVQAQHEPPPEVVAYTSSEDGQWLKDPVLYAAAYDAIERNRAIQAAPPMGQIEYAKAQVRMMFPDKFKTPTPPAPKATVDPGGMAPAIGGQRSEYDKLPASAKSTFQRFVKEGLFTDNKEGREKYAAEYNRA